MMLNPIFSQPTPPHLFRHMVVANSRYWLARAEREEEAVMTETPQLLKALDYVLALEDEAGAVSYFVDLAHVYNTLGLARAGLAEWDTAQSYFLTAVETWQNQKEDDRLTDVLDNLIWLICLLKPVG